MRFTINRRAFHKGINIIQKSATSKSFIEVLVHVLLELDENGLRLTSNNDVITISHLIPHETDGDILISNVEYGAILIKSEILIDLVRKIDNTDTITFEVFDETVIKIESNNFNATIIGKKANEYPEIDLGESGEKLELNARKFIEVVDQTSFAASVKDNPPFTALNFRAENGELEVTAMDVVKLARKTIAIPNGINLVFNLLSKTAETIARMVEDEGVLKIFVTRSRALFIFGNTKVNTRLIAAEYPNTRHIKINNPKYRLEVNSQQIITALERVSSLSATQEKTVRLLMSSKEVKVSSRDEGLGNAVEKLSTFYYNNEPLEVSCSFGNIISGLKALRCEEVVLEFEGEMRPFKISNSRDDSIMIMITPVRHT